MARVIYLEVLDARGQPRARVRVDAFPATLGRGYDSDVILDDPFIDPRHARLRPNGEGTYEVEDLGSVNGVHGAGRGGRQALLAVRPGDTFRLGKTTLRLCDAAQSLPATLVDREGTGSRLGRALTTPTSLALIAAALVVFSFTTWLDSYERVGAARVASDALPLLFAISLWAGAWALVSRIVTHRFAFLQHAAVAAALAVGVELSSTGTEWLLFLFPVNDWFTIAEGVLSVVLAVLLLYGHLTFASHLSRRSRWRAAVAVNVALFAAVGLIAVAEDEEFSTSLEYPAVLKPVPSPLLRSVTIAEFAESSARLRASVDSLAEE